MAGYTIYPVNADYRFKHEKMQGGKGMVWTLQKRGGMLNGQQLWKWIANAHNPIELGLYCARRGIMPDAENADELAALL